MQDNISTLLGSKRQPIHAGQAAALDPTGPQSPNMEGSGHIIIAVWLMILKAVNIKQQTIQMRAKMLQANAMAQIDLDNQLKNIKYYDIPSLQFKWQGHQHKHETWDPTPGGGGTVVTYYYTTYQKVYINQSQIQVAQNKNLQQNAIRQGIENKLVILQQVDQAKTTDIENIGNSEANQLQEENQILSILKSLTIKILQIKLRS